MDRIRIGIIGLGRGFSLMKCFVTIPECRVTAVCDKYKPKAEAVISRMTHDLSALWRSPADIDEIKQINCYTDHRQLLDDPEVDAVCLAVGPHENVNLACEALDAGKHVLCEVPLAFTMEDCWRMVHAVEKSGLKFAMAEQHRFAPYCQAMDKIVNKEKQIGKVLYAEGHYMHGLGTRNYWVDNKTGYSISIEDAKKNPEAVKSRFWHQKHPIYYLPHTLSPITMILDDRIKSVTCMGTRPQSYYYDEFPLPDLETALMKTENDTVVRVTTSFTFDTTDPHHWFNFMGVKGRVEMRRFKNDKDKIWLTDSFMEEPAKIDWCWQALKTTSAQRATGHGGIDIFPVKDFVDSFHENRDPFFNVYMAADNAAPAILAGQSAEENGMPFEVPDFRPEKRGCCQI